MNNENCKNSFYFKVSNKNIQLKKYNKYLLIFNSWMKYFADKNMSDLKNNDKIKDLKQLFHE